MEYKETDFHTANITCPISSWCHFLDTDMSVLFMRQLPVTDVKCGQDKLRGFMFQHFIWRVTMMPLWCHYIYIDGFVQEKHNAIADTLELHLFALKHRYGHTDNLKYRQLLQRLHQNSRFSMND